MKAAVLEELGKAPKYMDFAVPEIQNENQVLLNVKAAAVKNLDKLRAGGTHYASYTELPVVVGMDGVGVLEDGTRVYAQGISGMIAEKAIIDKNKYTVIPDGLDDDLAAALPNAVLGSAMALKVRGEIKPGQNVLINGATGVTGLLAVQVAKYYGAENIITTGRNQESLEKTLELGADQIISLKQEDDAIVEQLQKVHEATPIDLVIDYVWGKPAELILTALKGGGLDHQSHRTRIVSVGSMAGETISLPSGILRSSAIEILGSGFGSLSPDDLASLSQEVLPKMFDLAAKGKLKMDLVVDSIENIEQLWNQKIESGKRLVISIA
ncbi:zinc-binding alcohol dehydrogenase family protein [Weeksellaceae bacterium KMM 9713]|uniref:Zinc-binding alcohol dehydrogenase family protein n=1 Tax=Profundicola chukchiensis TaxID=2961959 RepID=A0A9X4MW86_9FLAO|nr:zinc-binding alcohol dehydrogenase family protein [Profundicola chukchiensis]MDG4946026.1 zinc-binding alcohol dehydrogenase family protein [Profundicola chukchiensis]